MGVNVLCKLHLIVVAALLLLTGCTALRMVKVSSGLTTTHLVYDPRKVGSGEMRFLYVKSGVSDLYVFGVTGGDIDEVVCRETVTTAVIVAPLGCDAPEKELATRAHNCGHKTAEGLAEYWTRAPADDECIRGGPTVSCIGPPVLAGSGVLARESDVLELMRGVYVRGGVGPWCAIKTSTPVDVELPFLTVNSTCTRLPAGVYVADTRAPQQTEYAFWKYAATIILRPSHASGEFMARILHDGEELWRAENVTMGVTVADPNGTCTFSVVLNRAPWPLVIRPQSIPTAANYFENKFPSYYHRSKACHIAVGRRDPVGNGLLLQGVAEGVPIGGIPVFRTKEGVPFQIDPDKRYADFDGDCVSFYPQGATFQGFGQNGFDGPTYDRYVPGMLSCFAPFPYPEAIIIQGTLASRAKQCKMLGGVISGVTSDVCAKDSWRTYCRKGWIFFDERCWYKFDDLQQTAYKVSAGSDSERVCRQISEHSISTISFPRWTSAWLQRFFVHWKFPGAIHRVVLKGDRCECYSAVDGVKPCSCQEPNFPLCSYHHRDELLYWTDTDFHPATLSILRDGQSGVPFDGREIPCKCLAGSSGEDCTTPTCVAPIEIEHSVNASLFSPLIVFFKKCYSHDRGVCLEGDPNECKCATGFGPPAHLLSGEGAFVNFPCYCPSNANPPLEPSTIIIDGTVYYSSAPLVCGGATHGECQLTGFDKGKCACVNRWSATREIEPAFAGESCSCAMPHYFPERDVKETLCNRRGVCCPSGERADGGIGNCAGAKDGCNCDEGMAGVSCTAPVPTPLKLVATPLLSEGTLQAALVNRAIIAKIYISGQGANSIELRDTLAGTPAIACTRAVKLAWEEERWGEKWACPPGSFARLVVVNATNTAEVAKIQIFEHDFTPCGFFVNLFSARFFSTERFRSYGGYQELQSFVFSQFGATQGACACAPGIVGEWCKIGISAFRLTEGTGDWAPRLCGDSTLPPRGVAAENECRCGALGTSIAFTGTSCECATVEGKMCGGIGECVATSFPLGFCSHDITRLARDSLRRPFSGAYGAGPGSLEERMSIIGRTDCSNPMHRTMQDAAVFAGFGQPGRLFCTEEPIVPYSNVLGVGYGLFYNNTPGLDFFAPWTARHFGFVASLLNWRRCELFDETDWDGYITGLVGQFMNNSIPVVDGEFVFDGLRHITATFPFEISAIRFKHPTTGENCGESANSFPSHTRIMLTCRCNSCSGVGLFVNGPALDWIEVGPANGTFTAAGPLDFLDGIYRSIFNDYAFPYNAALDSSGRCPSDVPRLDISNPEDQTFLKRIHSAHLAPRRCSSSDQCTEFEPNGHVSECIWESYEHRAWRNGDSTYTSDVAIGEEGGCDCSVHLDGFFSSPAFCASCEIGYGPDSEWDFQSMHLFAARLGDPDWIQGGLGNVRRCSLPSDATSGRISRVCGGRGSVSRAPITEQTIHAAQFLLPGQQRVVRRCSALVVGGKMYIANDMDHAHVDMHSFYGDDNSIANVIHGRVFVDGTEATRFDCTERLVAQSGRGLLFAPESGELIRHRQRDFFTSLLF